METAVAVDTAAERARRAAGIRIEALAMRSGRNRAHLYRSLDATFEMLATLAEHDRDAAFSFALAALLYGLDQRAK